MLSHLYSWLTDVSLKRYKEIDIDKLLEAMQRFLEQEIIYEDFIAQVIIASYLIFRRLNSIFSSISQSSKFSMKLS